MFHAYTGDEQFDLQLNRFTHPELDPSVKGDLAEVIPQLRTAGDWYPCWSELARRREVAGDHVVASGYWGAAAFYEPLDSETKRTAVAGFRREFYAGWDGPELERLEVPYAGSSLPALRIRTAAEHSAEPLLLFGGFDSYTEEMAGWLRALGDCGRDVVIFDGPGQGTALMRGLAMPLAWERPVGAVLDALEIERCAAMGMSLGGLLVMRGRRSSRASRAPWRWTCSIGCLTRWRSACPGPRASRSSPSCGAAPQAYSMLPLAASRRVTTTWHGSYSRPWPSRGRTARTSCSTSSSAGASRAWARSCGRTCCSSRASATSTCRFGGSARWRASS